MTTINIETDAVHPGAGYLTGLGLAAAGAIFFSAKTVVAKLMYAQGMDAITVIALRMLICAPLFLLVAVWTHDQKVPLSLRDYLQIAGLGLIGYYVSSMLDLLGLQYISAGLERLIMFLTPSFVLLIGLLVFKRKVSSMQWISMLFAYAGIVLVFWNDVSLGGSVVLLGSGLVLAAAITYAIYLLGAGELLKRVGTLRLTAGAMSACAFAGLAQYAALRPVETLFQQSAYIWQLALMMGLLCTVIPVFLTMFAVARIGAGHAAQAGMIGPVSTLFLAWYILSEPISGLQISGTLLVVVGIFLLSVRRVPVAVAQP